MSNYWKEVAGRLNNQDIIESLVVYNNKLYAGTRGNGADSVAGGRLFEWNGVDAWTQVADRLNAQNEIYSLAVFNNKLYGGTNGGRLFEWNGVDAWTQVAPQLNAQEYILSLAVYNNKLYGGTATEGNLFEWNGVNAWISRSGQLNAQTNISSLAVFNNKLYGGTFPNGLLFEWSSGSLSWIQVAGQQFAHDGIGALAVLNNKLYGLGNKYTEYFLSPCLFEWNGVNAWTQVAPNLNSQYTASGIGDNLVVLNGKLYAANQVGTLLEWNGVDAWTQVAPQLNAQNIHPMVVFNNKLYAGTYADFTVEGGGRLFEWTQVVLHDVQTGTSLPSDTTGVVSEVCTRVRTIRHVTSLNPWIV